MTSLVKETIWCTILLVMMSTPIIFAASFLGYDPRPHTFEILLVVAATAWARERLKKEGNQ